MKIQSPATKKARIEIIPMIDAIFFLLVFFMLSSLSMVKLKGIGIGLPTNNPPKSMTSPTAAQAAAMPKLVVSINDKGEYFINKDRSSAGTLQKDLQAQVLARPGAPIIVNVAKSQSTQSLITVMDSVNQIRTKDGSALQVMIATEPVDNNGLALPKKS
jgi:biopolymer transport protein ExbD